MMRPPVGPEPGGPIPMTSPNAITRMRVGLGLASCLLALLASCGSDRRARSSREGAAAPIATPATQARSSDSAAKIALQPLGLVPYDGSTLPVVSPDGMHIATQIGAGYTVADEPICIEIYDASRLPMTAIRTRADDPVVLAYGADAAGFFAYRFGADKQRVDVKVLPDGSIVDAPHPPLDSRAVDRITSARPPAMYAAALASIQQSPTGAAVFFDLASARVAVWMPDEPSPLLLAPGSIAGCWAGSDAVLVTTNEGLFLQRLAKDPTWRAAEPVRLLREPYVPRATTNPDRPFILIGPGPANKPELLQIMAMKLIEE